MTSQRHIRTLPAALLAALAALLLTLVATESVSVAQQPAPTEGEEKPGEDDARRAELRKQIEERIREARSRMLAEVVGLDEATIARVEPILEEIDRDRRTLHHRLKKNKRALQDLVESGASDAEIAPLLDSLIADQKALDDLKQAPFERTDGLLTTTQRAKLMAALPAFDRKVRKATRKARKKAHRKKRRGGRKGRGGGPNRR